MFTRKAYLPYITVLLTILVVACGVDTPTNINVPILQDSYEQATLTPPPTAIPATETPVPGGAAQVGQTFYQAWSKGDHLGMYSLLSPQSQALIDSTTFVRQYQQAEQTATVQTVSVQPIVEQRDGSRAIFQVRVFWETAALGTIIRDHNAELTYADGRWGIIWSEGLILPELEGGNRLVFEYKAPARANIYDIEGKAIAFQGSAVTLGVVPGEITDEAGLLNTVAPLLNQSPEDIKAKYASAQANWYVPIGDMAQDIFAESIDLLRPYFEGGLQADERLTRVYTNVAPHLIGSVGAIPDFATEEYAALGYSPDARVGLSGLERWGEPYLSGIKGGILSVINQNGVVESIIAENDPRQSRAIYTSFNTEFQLAVESALTEAAFTHPLGNRGAVVVMNVKTGAIEAMASYPSFDPTLFDVTRPNAGEALTALFNDPSRPLVNRAALGLYPPGSTFKLVTLEAAVQTDQYGIDSRYNSTGSWNRLGDEFIKTDWRDGGHGNITLKTAIVVSCNTCFYDAGYNMNEVDPYHFPNVARSFGLGAPTGIIGIEELAGTIPDPEWKLGNTAEGGWVPGDAVNMSIGQGYVEVTPLQMAQITAGIANDGQLMVPTLINRLGAGGGAPEEPVPPQNAARLPYDDFVLTEVQDAMFQVGNGSNGTASETFRGFSPQVAGKTGTAENIQINPHAWFIGYTPAAPYLTPDGRQVNEPEIAIAVIMENSGDGSAVAAPIFRRVVELYYGLPISPYPW
ncbi:MAG: penicillin-binding transpeptidase domain-containing protein [Chloroflexota bacterium]